MKVEGNYLLTVTNYRLSTTQVVYSDSASSDQNRRDNDDDKYFDNDKSKGFP